MSARPERILIIRPSALGDVCRTVPVLSSLRRAYPEARIDWLVQESFVPAIASHPGLTGVVPFQRERMSVASLWRSDQKTLLSDLLRRLRRPRYDLVLDCQGLGRSGFFALATGARRRVGYADAGEFGWLGLTERVRVPRGTHTVDRMLALAAAAGAEPEADMRLYTSPGDRSAQDPRLRGARFVLVAPTSRWPGKRWPEERFAEVVSGVLKEGLVERIAVVGAGSEREQCGALLSIAARDDRVVDLIGKTTVGGLMAAVEASSLVLANDSAALHMAVGFGRPLVGVFGPTRLDLVGPYRREADVISVGAAPPRNLHKDEAYGRSQMERIPVERVMAAVRERLAQEPAERVIIRE